VRERARESEVGDEQILLSRAHAHRQLVAKIARRRIAHSGDAQVFAQTRRDLDVEIVERDDAIDRLCATKIAHAFDHVLDVGQRRQIEEVVDRFARPVGLRERLSRQEKHARALGLTFADEGLAFLIAGQAENRQLA
jgi:hypothetical protein